MVSLFSTGGQLDEFLKPRLYVVENDFLSPLAWYNNPKISTNNMLCFVKIGVQVITVPLNVSKFFKKILPQRISSDLSLVSPN